MTSLFPPRKSLVVTSRLGTGNSQTFFLLCTQLLMHSVYANAMLSVQSSELGPPAPSSASECCAPFWVLGGYTLACGWGGGGDPIPTKGQTLWYSMYTAILLRTSVHVSLAVFSQTKHLADFFYYTFMRRSTVNQKWELLPEHEQPILSKICIMEFV